MVLFTSAGDKAMFDSSIAPLETRLERSCQDTTSLQDVVVLFKVMPSIGNSVIFPPHFGVI